MATPQDCWSFAFPFRLFFIILVESLLNSVLDMYGDRINGFHFFQLHVNKTPLDQKQKRGSIGRFNRGRSKMIPYVRTDLKPYPIPR